MAVIPTAEQQAILSNMGPPLYPVNSKGTSAPAAPNPTNTAQSKTGAAPETIGEEIVVTGRKSKTSKPLYAQASEHNVLNNYRSYTYNFTIGAIPKDVVNNSKNLELLDNAVDDFHVLDTAGKSGNNGGGISTSDVAASSKQKADVVALVDSFNTAKDNPGYYDMYMDDLSIDSVIGAGTQQTGSSAATSIEFDVFEPYSINGFIESLQVASTAAGYQDYIQATYCLRVRFQGYKDTDIGSAFPIPEIIPKTTRYFNFTITGVGISISEAGTKYRVTATPFNQMGFGRSNIQIGDINVSGKTVFDVLQAYFKQLNVSSKNNATEATKGSSSTSVIYDMYEISAPSLVIAPSKQDTDGALIYTEVSDTSCPKSPNTKMNTIVSFNMVDGLNDSQQTHMPADKPEDHAGGTHLGKPTTPSPATKSATPKPIPQDASFAFKAGQPIHESIATIVKDSTYVRNDVLQKQLIIAKQSGNDPLITYFTIRMEVKNNKRDASNNRDTYIYRYVLEPFQTPYTKIPTQDQGNVNYKPILDKIKREFNYIYTGKNSDVLKFDLKFDNLYYSGVPKMFGNTPAAATAANTAGATNKDKTIQQDSPNSVKAAESTAKVATGQPVAPASATPPEANTFNSPVAGMIQNDPFHRLARQLHQNIIESVDQCQGDLEIIGDPYFFVTGTSAIADLELVSFYETNDGQAPVTQGDVMIYLAFRNPIDISQGSKPSLAVFDKDLIPWSGIYKVILVKNNFKEGVFTQVLSLIRLPGQVIGASKAIAAADLKAITSPEPGAALTKDTAAAGILKTGFKVPSLDLGNLLGARLPTPGLPGISHDSISVFSQASSNAFTQVSGIANNAQTQLGMTPIGASAVFDSTVRSGVTSLAVSASTLNSAPTDASAATVPVAGDLMSQTGNIQNAASNLASNLTTLAPALGTAFPQSVLSAANNVASAVGNIGSNITKLQNSIPTDVTGIASKLGIDTSQISGLGKQLASKLNAELGSIAALVPDNTNLAGLEQLGVNFQGFNKIELGHLPALQLDAIAPSAIFDPARIAITDAIGNIIPLLNGSALVKKLPGFGNITDSLGTAAGLSSKFGEAVTSLTDKVTAANNAVNNVTALTYGVTTPIGSLSQNAISSIMPASVNLGSAESNLALVSSLSQSVPGGISTQIGATLNAQLGSKQAVSPLTALVQNSNNLGTLV